MCILYILSPYIHVLICKCIYIYVCIFIYTIWYIIWHIVVVRRYYLAYIKCEIVLPQDIYFVCKNKCAVKLLLFIGDLTWQRLISSMLVTYAFFPIMHGLSIAYCSSVDCLCLWHGPRLRYGRPMRPMGPGPRCRELRAPRLRPSSLHGMGLAHVSGIADQ